MKKIPLFLATSLCLGHQSFAAHVYFANDIGRTSVETAFSLHGGGEETLEKSRSGYLTSGNIDVSQTTGYRMANPDGTGNGTTYAAYNRAFLWSNFSGGVLTADGGVDSEQWGDDADYPQDYMSLVTDTNVAATVALYWDFIVSGGDITIDASLHADDPTDVIQYVRLSGSDGSIFDLTAGPPGASPRLSAPLTLTPGRYLLQAYLGERNGDDDLENEFRVQLRGVDSLSRRDVPDGGSSVALLAVGILSIAATRRLLARNSHRG